MHKLLNGALWCFASMVFLVQILNGYFNARLLLYCSQESRGPRIARCLGQKQTTRGHWYIPLFQQYLCPICHLSILSSNYLYLKQPFVVLVFFKNKNPYSSKIMHFCWTFIFFVVSLFVGYSNLFVPFHLCYSVVIYDIFQMLHKIWPFLMNLAGLKTCLRPGPSRSIEPRVNW